MKKILLLLLFLASLLVLPARNKALLVGISDYPDESGWCKLSSARDVELIGATISPSFDVITLIDDKATYNGIICALDDLISCAQIGDTIFIHFSCHGQQMVSDDNNEVDFLDEALIPYDALSKSSKDYKGEYHLKDDILSGYILKIRHKVGCKGLVVVTLDSCHSDSMDRDTENESTDDIYRGGLAIFGSNVLSPDSLIAIKERWKSKQKSDLYNDTLAHIIYLSACNSYERNKEIVVDSIGYGSLSYAVVKAFNEYDLSNITEWRNSIIALMKEYVPFQSPQTRSSLEFDVQLKSAPIIEISSSKGIDEIHVGVAIAVLILLSIIIWKILRSKK